MSAEVCAPSPSVATLEVDERHALKVSRWLVECGGVAVFGCLDLSDPSRQFFTPAHLSDGTPSRCPHWSSPSAPERIVTDAAEVEVVTHREVGAVRIAVRAGAYGAPRTLTPASEARLHAALAKAGPGSVYVFDGDRALVFAEVSRVPLPRWLVEHADGKT